MRDISNKAPTLRETVAAVTVRAQPATIGRLREGDVPKADPLVVARVAGIQAAKNVARLIPYCHNVPLSFVGLEFSLGDAEINITATVRAVYATGVEMEALAAAAAAALTLYDMLKPVDDAMVITDLRVVSKKGGQSDFVNVYDRRLRAAVLVSSDSAAAGEKEDKSGKLIMERLKAEGFEVVTSRIVPDDAAALKEALIYFADELNVDLVLTTGGTGFGPRDVMPEVTAEVMGREAPGIAEAMRGFGQRRTHYAMLSRGRAGLRGKTLIINLPGSTRGVAESLDALFPGLLHAFGMLAGAGHAEAEAPHNAK